MARTTLGSENQRDNATAAVDALLNSELSSPVAYGAMLAPARLELIRKTLVLLLRVSKRILTTKG